jgi:putative oxidoreductase
LKNNTLKKLNLKIKNKIMNTLVNKFFATDTNNWSLLVSRLALGIVILPHGMQKALGSFGGYGFEATLGAFTGMGMPMLLGVLVILAEFVGAIPIKTSCLCLLQKIYLLMYS